MTSCKIHLQTTIDSSSCHSLGRCQ